MPSCREWLRANGYADVAEAVDGVMTEWRLAGKKTRRDWWEILAGDKNGKPRVAGGVTFPVLKAAQVREGRPNPQGVTRRRGEKAPPKLPTNRWPK